MDIKTSKIILIKEILDIETPELIEKIIKLLKNEKKDFWDHLSDQQQQEILKADTEIAEEETIDYETFISSHRNE